MGNENNPGCLGCIGDYITQYMGFFISQYKDPYKPTTIMESRRVFFVAQLVVSNIFSCSPLPGEMIQNWTNIFQMG